MNPRGRYPPGIGNGRGGGGGGNPNFYASSQQGQQYVQRSPGQQNQQQFHQQQQQQQNQQYHQQQQWSRRNQASVLPPLRPNPDLSPTAQRIIHSLNTLTSPSHLPQIQAQILLHNLHPNTHVSAAFVSACAHLRRPRPALLLFSLLRRPHVFLCNTLIRLLPSPHPLQIYSHMRRLAVSPNRFTFPLLLKSLSSSPSPPQLHAHILKSPLSHDLYVQNSLLNLYSSSAGRRVSECERLFDEMPIKEVVAWSTMINIYRISNRPADALLTFERMHFSGTTPNRVTMVNALAACGAHGALDVGVWIHEHVRRSGWELDVVLGTALVDMYRKCGRIEDSISVFSTMKVRNVYTWNSVIRGLALAKSGGEALRWFDDMEVQGIRPDGVTLIGVLCACSHSGMVEEGRRIFDSLVSGEYGFCAGIKHYGCMVDLLGRAGRLDEALRFVEQMPYEPNTVIWGSMLGGCRSNKDWRLSEFAAKRLVELEPWNVAHYVLLSNVYAEMERWSDVEEVRRVMRERGLRKDAGWSFAESDETEDCLAADG